MAGQTQRQNSIVLVLMGVVLVGFGELIGSGWWWSALWFLGNWEFGYWYGLGLGMFWSGVSGLTWGLPSLVMIGGMMVMRGFRKLAGDSFWYGLGMVEVMMVVGNKLMGEGVGLGEFLGVAAVYMLLFWWLGNRSELRLKQW
jgi:hypothetical protein